ncbi:MAG: PQQ-binding-like beta-propeller repeat protein [Deltaproteobacteria bacterium]|nr:PQQ-binding-like beta-propeller repeat protein [Deltaproteobacteria bacterium]
MNRRYRLLPALALVALAGCMPAVRRLNAFSSRFSDNQREAVTQVFASLPSQNADRPTNSLNRPVLVGIRQAAPRAVVAVDGTTGAALWTQELDAQSAPEILGDLVLVSTGARAVALDLASGARRWEVDLRSMPLVGAARDGNTVVVVASSGANGGPRAGRVLAVAAATGGEMWSHQVVGILGRPAAVSGHVFVPWDRQSLAVLDLATGVEQSRLRATDDVLSWVFAAPQGVFYGSRGAYRWSPRSASGTRADSDYAANPIENVPGDPSLFRDGFVPNNGTRTARDKIQFAFLPRAEADGHLAIAHDTIFLVYYRFILAFNAQTGAVRWARAVGPDEAESGANATESVNEAARRAQAAMSQYDIESVTVTPTSLVVISANGKLRSIDPATGAVQGSLAIAGNLGAYTVDLGGFRAPSAGAEPAPTGAPRDQLVGLIRDADNRLVPMRGFLTRVLARDPAPEVTRELLELYRARAIPIPLRQEIAQALRTRTTGQQFLIEAIDGPEDHYNYLENRQAPPLDIIAPTLASMGAREAVPRLMEHLLDHETPVEWLPMIVQAIVDLEDNTAVEPLKSFIRRYRSDSAFAGDRVAPLVAASSAVFRLGDAQGREWLGQMRQDVAAHQSLRDGIARLFDEEQRGAQGRTDEQRLTAAREQLQGRTNALRTAIGSYPSSLSQEQVDDEWNNHLDELRQCAQGVLTRRPDLNEIRITVTVRSEPSMSLFQTSPPAPALAANATLEQRLAAIQTQQDWVEQQVNNLEAFESTVRNAAYSPQDRDMQTCMDAIVRPMKFPGFGRGISTRQFVQRISTVRSATRAATPPGFGTAASGSVLVPWFLVSSPSLDSSGRLVEAPAAVVSVPTPPPVETTPNGPPTLGGPPTLSGPPPAGPPPAGPPPAGPPPAGPPQLGAPPAPPVVPTPPGVRPPAPPGPPVVPPAGPPTLPSGPPTPPGAPVTAPGGARPWWEQS